MRTPWGLKFTSLKSGYRPFIIDGWRISIVWHFWLHYINPMTYINWLKDFCHRGFYGYSTRDCINADHYLSYVICEVIKDLKNAKPGVPSSVLPNDLKYTDEEYDKYQKIWYDILQEIIDGLEASNELEEETTIPDGTYSNEPVEWEDLGNGMCRLKDTGKPRFNKELYLEWRKPLEKKERRAAILLIKYWKGFWV